MLVGDFCSKSFIHTGSDSSSDPSVFCFPSEKDRKCDLEIQ